MNLIHGVFSILLILVNLFGLTIAMLRWLPSVAIARAVGVLVIVTGFFFVENFIGLGELGWLWPLSTALALAVLYRDRARWTTTAVWRAEAVFIVGFAYGLFWRASAPDITPTSERITDLYFIVNYLEGVRLPPVDHWLPALRFDFYYALQHYGAALMARVFALSPGHAYNLGFALLAGLSLSLAWDFAARFLASRAAKILVVASLAIGGTGATPFLQLAYERPADAGVGVEIAHHVWGNARFIGGAERHIVDGTGKPLFEPPPEGFTPRVLPSENFGYQFPLGDFHPPLGGFFLFLLAIALVGAIEFPRESRSDRSARLNERTLTALLAATVPLQLATNTWVFPLQGLWVLIWAAWRWSAGRVPDWRALLAGGLGTLVLLFPFLRGFAERSGDGAIELVRFVDITPWPQFLAVHWPVLLFVGLALVVGVGAARRSDDVSDPQGVHRGLLAAFAAAIATMLAFSEMIFFNDPSGDFYERTNTVMKWWGFIQSGGVVALGALLLAQSQRWIKVITAGALLVTSAYSVDVFRHWNTLDLGRFGALRGDAAYTQDPVVREMFRYLERAPRGVVLENQYCDVYCDSGVYALFAAKPIVLNWPLHQQTWRQNIGSAWILKEEILRFYAGNHPRPRQWLDVHRVDYVVWTRRDAADAAAWQRIDAAIGSTHEWREFARAGEGRIGFWVRRQLL